MRKELLPLVNKSNPNETSLETANVLSYELGDLTKMFFYHKIYNEIRGQNKKAFLIEARIAMSDMLAQCLVLCERQGWDFDETVKLGEDRLTERIERRLQFGE